MTMEDARRQGGVERGATMFLLFCMGLVVAALALGLGLAVSAWFFLLLLLLLLLLPFGMYGAAMWYARRSQSAPHA